MTSRAPQSCIVLAGGLGTRLRSVVGDLPKGLAPVGRRTFLELQIDALLAAGIDEVILSLGYQADVVVRALERTLATRPVRHVIEPSPLGTGGALAHVMDTLALDEALAANGDTYLSCDLAGMLAPLQRGRGELFRMATLQVPDRSRYGGVRVGAQGQVEGFSEKGTPGPGAISVGFYRLCRESLPAAGSRACSLETEVLPALVARGAVSALPLQGDFIDIGVPADYHRFCQQYRE